MNSNQSPKSTGRSVLALLGLAAAAALGFAALGWPPDGNEHATLAQFIGRFHPLLVHAPIAFLVLVPLLEIAGMAAGGAHLRATAGFVLGLTAAVAIAAALDGWLLAWSGGYSGRLVTRHMWGGISLAAVCVAAAWLRGEPGHRSPARATAYALLLAAAVGVMVWTSHQGGSISQGENFLTERMPGRLRGWLGLPPPALPVKPAAAPAAPAKAAAHPSGASGEYAAAIAPILERSCVSCHRPAKHKGGLRMDTYELLMAGGEDGLVIEPGKPEASEMIRRVTLPADDDDFMPNDGKKLLTPAEIQLLRRWIAEGAKRD